MLILGTFFSENNKHWTMKLYIATFPLSMHKLCFFVNIGENLVPFMGVNILINVKKLTHRKIIIIWEPIAQTLYIKHTRLFIMNKAMSVQSFTYLGLVVSKKNVPKNWLI